ncbi:hypothetical protein CRUP_009724, partial [Coryphaenoides rupestris]
MGHGEEVGGEGEEQRGVLGPLEGEEELEEAQLNSSRRTGEGRPATESAATRTSRPTCFLWSRKWWKWWRARTSRSAPWTRARSSSGGLGEGRGAEENVLRAEQTHGAHLHACQVPGHHLGTDVQPWQSSGPPWWQAAHGQDKPRGRPQCSTNGMRKTKAARSRSMRTPKRCHSLWWIHISWEVSRQASTAAPFQEISQGSMSWRPHHHMCKQGR